MHAQDEKVIQNWMRWQIWISSQRASRLQTVCGDWLTGRHLQDSFAALLPAVSHEQRKGKWRVTEPLSLIVTDQCNAIWRLKTKTCQSALLQLCFVKVWFVVIDHTLSSTIWHSRVQWCKIFCWVFLLSVKYKLFGKYETTITYSTRLKVPYWVLLPSLSNANLLQHLN